MSWKQRLRYNPLQSAKKKKKGVALMMAITSLMLMVYVATEVSRDSLVEFAVNAQELNRIKTYYAARNGMQIALLRIKLFQQASRFPLPAGFKKHLDQIWKFPFAWPLPLPKELNSVDRESMQKLTKESLMDATYTHTIEDEGTKIDINDLISPSKTLQQITKMQILNIFQQKIESDDEFRQNYQSFRFEDLVNHMIDWMSDSNTSADGGQDKKSAFSSLGEGYPPNRGFRTIEEVRLVPGMTEEFFNLLLPRITVYGMKAINPNTAPPEVIKSLDPSMTDTLVKDVLGSRAEEPFEGDGEKCLKGFKAFLEQKGANRLAADFDKIPMTCDTVINFRVKSTGIYGSGKASSMKNIVAVVIDLNRSAQQVKKFIEEDKKKQQNGSDPSQQQNNGAQQNNGQTGSKASSEKQDPLPKGPPRVVYWTEF